MATYTYLNTDFKNAVVVDLAEVQSLVVASAITTGTILNISSTNSINYFFNFTATLSPGDKTILDGIVSSYVKTTVQEDTISNTSTTTVSNKTFLNDTNFFVDPTDPTKRIGFLATSASTGTKLTLSAAITTNRTITFPNITDVVVTNTIATQLTNKIILSGLYVGQGSTLITSGTANFNPSLTALTGANNYYFNVFRTPSTSGSTTGATYNLYIEGSSTGGASNFSIYVNGGKTYIGGPLQFNQSPTNGHVLVSDASGNASWQAPTALAVSFGNGSVGAPSIFFTNFATTGFYAINATQVGLSLSGVKYHTFTNVDFQSTVQIKVQTLTNQLALGTTNVVTINAAAPAAARTYTIPDVGAATANFILTTSSAGQTIAGGLTSSALLTASAGFTANGALNLTGSSGAIALTGVTHTTNETISISRTTNQLILGNTNTVTLTSPAPSASRTYTIPDIGTNANFIMSDGAQTISAIKTFASTTEATSSTLGATIFSGGLAIAKNMWMGSSSTSTVNGANGLILNIPNITLTNGTTGASSTTAFTNLISFRQPTFNATNTAVTTTEASTLYIEGPPIKGTNQTFTTAYGINVDVGSALSATVTRAASVYIEGAPTVTSGSTYALYANSGATHLGGPVVIPTGAVDKYVLTSDGSGNATWQPPALPYQNVLLNSTLSSTATILTNITGVSVTIAIEGTYRLTFNAGFSSNATNRTVVFDITRNNVAITNVTTTHLINLANTRFSVTLEGISAASIADVFRVRASISASTLTIGPYISFIAVRLDA